MSILISKKKHALIKITKKILNTSENITETHVDELKVIIQNHLNSGMSPNDIKLKYNLDYTDFGMFIKKSLNLKIKSLKDAVNNFYIKQGKNLSDKKSKYKKSCMFTFDAYSIPEIPGYKLLLERGIYHPTKNPKGVCRDHIISIEYGWRNNIDASIISSPFNCQFLTNYDNIKKGSSCDMDIDFLIERIQNNKYEIINNQSIKLPKTQEHKNKISETNKKYMNITNGIINLRILKTETIPEGFKRGMTRKK